MCVWLILPLLALVSAARAKCAEVWSGPMIGFTNVAGSNPTQASSQDRITPSVWLTRGGIQGIYNIVAETGYTQSLSPIGTEWAYGELTNYASLVYNTWVTWAGGPGPPGPLPTSSRSAAGEAGTQAPRLLPPARRGPGGRSTTRTAALFPLRSAVRSLPWHG